MWLLRLWWEDVCAQPVLQLPAATGERNTPWLNRLVRVLPSFCGVSAAAMQLLQHCGGKTSVHNHCCPSQDTQLVTSLLLLM